MVKNKFKSTGGITWFENAITAEKMEERRKERERERDRKREKKTKDKTRIESRTWNAHSARMYRRSAALSANAIAW